MIVLPLGMQGKGLVSKLHSKFAEKSWNETLQLVRRCMDKSRDASKPCEPLVRSLKRLQEVLQVTSVNTTRSRLETIAIQHGLGFIFTEATCLLTAELFYLEVLLLPCGGVQEVNVAPHGRPPTQSESLLNLLRSNKFAEFSVRLGGLVAQYNILGDKEIKPKLLASLQHLGKDLLLMSNLQRESKLFDPQMDLINNGRLGLVAQTEDSPLTLQFYVPPANGIVHSEPLVQAAQVTVGISDVCHRFQMDSVILQPPEPDINGCPQFVPLSEVQNELLPACFLLKLQPPVPMTAWFFDGLKQITELAVPDIGLQWAPLPKLLSQASEDRETFTVSLPGDWTLHCVLPGAAWDQPAQRAAFVDSVPFTHPAHVPAVLELLRHQCAVNHLLRSCVAAQSGGLGLICGQHLEILPESNVSFSVTFQQPHTESLAVLLVNMSNHQQIICRLFSADLSDPLLDEYISTVMKRSLSVPVTMQAVYRKLEGRAAIQRVATEAENAPESPRAGDASVDSPALVHSPTGPKDGVSVSASAPVAISAAKAQPLLEIDTGDPVKAPPAAPVGGFALSDAT